MSWIEVNKLTGVPESLKNPNVRGCWLRLENGTILFANGFREWGQVTHVAAVEAPRFPNPIGWSPDPPSDQTITELKDPAITVFLEEAGQVADAILAREDASDLDRANAFLISNLVDTARVLLEKKAPPFQAPDRIDENELGFVHRGLQAANELYYGEGSSPRDRELALAFFDVINLLRHDAVSVHRKKDGLLLIDTYSGESRFATWKERFAYWLCGSVPQTPINKRNRK